LLPIVGIRLRPLDIDIATLETLGEIMKDADLQLATIQNGLQALT